MRTAYVIEGFGRARLSPAWSGFKHKLTRLNQCFFFSVFFLFFQTPPLLVVGLFCRLPWPLFCEALSCSLKSENFLCVQSCTCPSRMTLARRLRPLFGCTSWVGVCRPTGAMPPPTSVATAKYLGNSSLSFAL